MNEERHMLVCAPLASAAMVARNSTTNQKCSKCEQRVLLAPSGQRFLKEHPDAAILCALCYSPNADDKPHLAAPEAEILAEMETAQPNTWRNRN
jgi:hypothetical protein